MDNFIDQYPDVASYLDDTADFKNVAEERALGNERFLIVTQTSLERTGQVLFQIDSEGGVHFKDADAIVSPENHSAAAASAP